MSPKNISNEKCFLAASRLLRKADQARAVLSVSHISWSGKVKRENGEVKELQDAKKVVDCIRKALKTADKCLEAFVRMQLWIEILEKIYFYKSEGLENSSMEQLGTDIMEKTENQTVDESNNDTKILLNHFRKIKAKINGEEVIEDEPEVEPEVEPKALEEENKSENISESAEPSNLPKEHTPEPPEEVQTGLFIFLRLSRSVSFFVFSYLGYFGTSQVWSK